MIISTSKSVNSIGQIFEKAASDTWQRLEASSRLGVSQGETTITDIILLDLKKAKCPFIHLIKTPQDLESSQGTDWEWWIGSNSFGWIRYAVQAKRIDLSSLKNYGCLAHKVKQKVNGKTISEKLQIDILRNYSSANKALGRYCFYNYTNYVDPSLHWHCNLSFDSTQLGCSIATLSTVNKAINTRGCRNFDFIHSAISTLPLRCLVTCPAILSGYGGGTGTFPAGFEDYENAHIFESLPRNIQEGIETGSFEEWDSDFYSNEVQCRPERILVAQLPT